MDGQMRPPGPLAAPRVAMAAPDTGHLYVIIFCSHHCTFKFLITTIIVEYLF